MHIYLFLNRVLVVRFLPFVILSVNIFFLMFFQFVTVEFILMNLSEYDPVYKQL